MPASLFVQPEKNKAAANTKELSIATPPILLNETCIIDGFN